MSKHFAQIGQTFYFIGNVVKGSGKVVYDTPPSGLRVAGSSDVRLAVLLSGRGSNFQAIHEADAARRARRGDRLRDLESSRRAGDRSARASYGYAAHVIDHKAFANRAAHEEEVLRVLDEARPDFIALAGYMRLLGASFIER